MSDAPNSGQQAIAKVGLDSKAFASGVRAIISSINEMKSALPQIAQTSQQSMNAAARSTEQYNTSLKNLTTQATAVIGVLGGIAAVQRGIGAAQNVRQIEAMFNILSGGAERGQERLQGLRDLADETGQGFLTMAQSAMAILPAVSRANVDLGQTVQLAQRLAILDPAQGVEGAAFAIRELLGGSYTSLAARFELSRVQLRELVAAAGGDPQEIINGLDAMVNAMGLTNEAMSEMNRSGANAFAVLNSNVQEAMGQAFEPFLVNFLLPATKQMAEFVAQLNVANPEVLQFAASGAAILAGLIPATMAVTQLRAAIDLLKASAGGRIALNIAVTAAAIGAGVMIGTELVKVLAANGQEGGDFDRIRAGEDAGTIIGERLKQAFVIIVDMLAQGIGGLIMLFEGGAIWIGNGLNALVAILDLGGQTIKIAFAQMITGFGTVINALGELLADLPGGQQLRDLGSGMMESGDTMRTQALEQMARSVEVLQHSGEITEEQMAHLNSIIPALREAMTGTTLDLMGMRNQIKDNKEMIGTGLPEVAATPLANPKTFTAEQIEAFAKFQEDVANIETRRTEQLLASDQQYLEQRTNMIADYEERLSDMMEDEQLRRSRAVAQLAKQEAKIRADVVANEKKSRDDLTKRVKEARDDAAEREANELADHLEEMSRMNEDHHNTLANAARRLDARAVIEELEKNKQAVARAEQDFQEGKTKQQQQLEEQIAAEIAKNEEMLVEQRIAAEAQIAEMKASFAEQEALHEEDRQRQLARMQREQNQAMANADQQFIRRQEQINQQAAKETLARNTAFANEMNQLGGHMGRMLNVQKQGQAAMENAMLNWWTNATKQIGMTPLPSSAAPKYVDPKAPPAFGSGLGSGNKSPNANNFGGGSSNSGGGSGSGSNNFGGIQSGKAYGNWGSISIGGTYASGTSNVPKTGIYGLHAGEGVVRADVMRRISSMLGGANQQNMGIAALSGGGIQRLPAQRGGGSIGQVNNNFGDVGSYSQEQIAAIVYDELENILDQAQGQ